MLEAFDGTLCGAIFECIGSPADSKVNSVCVLKEWD